MCDVDGVAVGSLISNAMNILGEFPDGLKLPGGPGPRDEVKVSDETLEAEYEASAGVVRFTITSPRFLSPNSVEYQRKHLTDLWLYPSAFFSTIGQQVNRVEVLTTGNFSIPADRITRSDFSPFLDNHNMPVGQVIFEIEGKELTADRFVLAVRSQYFETMFTAGMSEAQNERVKISQASYSAFKAVLRFIYSAGSIGASVFDDVSAMELLDLSVEYLLEDLTRLCEAKLIQGMTFESAIAMFRVARSLGDKAPALLDASVDALKGRMAEVPKDAIAELCQCPQVVHELFVAVDRDKPSPCKRRKL